MSRNYPALLQVYLLLGMWFLVLATIITAIQGNIIQYLFLLNTLCIWMVTRCEINDVKSYASFGPGPESGSADNLNPKSQVPFVGICSAVSGIVSVIIIAAKFSSNAFGITLLVGSGIIYLFSFVLAIEIWLVIRRQVATAESVIGVQEVVDVAARV